MKNLIIFFIGIERCISFLVGLDFNTFSASELNDVVKYIGRVDFSWAITGNSGSVPDSVWREAFSATNRDTVFSEDNPGSYNECSAVRNYSGTLTAAFGYHETGGEPRTQLNYNEITEYSNNCQGAGVIILTRAYWPNSDWRKNTDAVLHHPKLYGVAMEFNPDDFGKRNEVDFITNVLAAGKSAFFLLPFKSEVSIPTEKQITSFIQYLKNAHSAVSDSRVRIVLARYYNKYIKIAGQSNSIQSAVRAAQNLK